MDSQSHQFQVPNKPRQMPQSPARRVIAVSVRPLEDREWSADCLDRNGRSLYMLYFSSVFPSLIFARHCLQQLNLITHLEPAALIAVYLAGKERFAVFGPKFSLKV